MPEVIFSREENSKSFPADSVVIYSNQVELTIGKETMIIRQVGGGGHVGMWDIKGEHFDTVSVAMPVVSIEEQEARGRQMAEELELEVNSETGRYDLAHGDKSALGFYKTFLRIFKGEWIRDDDSN